MAHGRRSESDLHFKGPGAAWAGLPTPRSHGTKHPLSFTYSGNLLSSYCARTWSWALGTRGLTDRWADVLLHGQVACRWRRSQPCRHRGGAGEGTGMCGAERLSAQGHRVGPCDGRDEQLQIRHLRFPGHCVALGLQEGAVTLATSLVSGAARGVQQGGGHGQPAPEACWRSRTAPVQASQPTRWHNHQDTCVMDSRGSPRARHAESGVRS